MLISRAEIQAGDNVLVLGASGGVGQAAVQIADYAGAKVYATGSSEEKLEYAASWVPTTPSTTKRRTSPSECANSRTGAASTSWWTTSARRPGTTPQIPREGRKNRNLWGDHRRQPETNINRVFWKQISVIGSTMARLGEADDVMALVWDGTFEPRIPARPCR